MTKCGFCAGTGEIAMTEYYQKFDHTRRKVFVIIKCPKCDGTGVENYLMI